MSLVEDLQKFQAKRKFPDWKPKANTGRYVAKNTPAEEVVRRCISLVDLEVQVGDWVEHVSKDLPDVAQILLRNVADEQKHDIAIRDLQNYYGMPKPTLDTQRLVKQWQELDCSPVVAAYALEMGVFFTILPILRNSGDVYAATVSNWINDDERVHVETNLRLMKHFGLKIPAEVILLVFHTVVYIFQPMGIEKAEAEGRRACKRLVSTKDPQMLMDSLPITISFFEQNSNQDIVYGDT